MTPDMSGRLANLAERITTLEAELHEELQEELVRARKRFLYRLERNRVRFDREVLPQHRRLKVGLGRFILTGRLRNVVSAPIVYALIVPFGILDLAVSIYQAVCFRLYGIERVRRRDYLVVDRHHLRYLNALERLNCFYCSYANGLIAYVREIAARTEQYWCPIKHARPLRHPHSRYQRFVDYGDARAYRDRSAALRAELADVERHGGVRVDPMRRARRP